MARLGKNYSIEYSSAHRHLHRPRSKAEMGMSDSRSEIISWCLAGIGLLLILFLHLIPALLAGLLVYELVHVMAPTFQRHLSSDRARLVAVVILSMIIVGLLTAGIIGTIIFFRSDAGSLPALVRRLADIIEGSRNMLPAWIMQNLPTNPDALRDAIAMKLRQYAPELQLVGKEAGRTFAHILIGMIIGAMVSLRDVTSHHPKRPLAHALTHRIKILGDSFRRIVFAQVRISLINAIFTGIYLIIVLPFFGIHLPLSKTLIVITFVVGLLPVAGNLISNTVIVIVSLSHSLHVAIGSLAFLVIIHKLEYFLNARIIGTEIKSRPWELLIAMLLMEATFGLPGVAAAPIYYAYLKQELTDKGMV